LLVKPFHLVKLLMSLSNRIILEGRTGGFFADLENEVA
jgi:hypothetical protein